MGKEIIREREREKRGREKPTCHLAARHMGMGIRPAPRGLHSLLQRRKNLSPFTGSMPSK